MPGRRGGVLHHSDFDGDIRSTSRTCDDDAISDSGDIASWPWVSWSGRPNTFTIVEDPSFRPFSFAFSSQGEHHQHLESNLLEVEGEEDDR